MATAPSKSVADICAILATHLPSRVAAREGRSYLALLPLLEHPLADVQSQFEPALAAAGIPPEEAAAISLRSLVLDALRYEYGGYWGSLAVSWVEAGFPIDPAIADALEGLAKDKRYSQQTRHLAFALAKRWRRSLEHPG